MKSKMLLMTGIAGMLLSSPSLDALADVDISVASAPKRVYVIKEQPTFVRLDRPGFRVSVGAPYDIVLYGNDYYLHDHGRWYRSARYDGPWREVRSRHLPPRIRRYRIEQIRRMRDDEYRRHRDRYDHRWNDDRRPGSWDGPGRR